MNIINHIIAYNKNIINHIIAYNKNIINHIIAYNKKNINLPCGLEDQNSANVSHVRVVRGH